MAMVACVDVGSTYTKGVLVDTEAPDPIVASHSVLTTNPLAGTGVDVYHGLAQVVAATAASVERDAEVVLAASSAGGGLRIAVVGFESVVTAEAGRRAALTSGGKVVHVFSGRLSGMDLVFLTAAEPDLVLLVGGTDGGNSEVLLHNAAVLTHLQQKVPIVVAGNADAAGTAEQVLAAGGLQVAVADNVLPEIGSYEPQSARLSIRESFLHHVIGGKGLSQTRQFREVVQGATPDVVFSGVEVLADTAGDVLVVDVGGATTDVYSVLHPEGEAATIRREVVAPAWRLRTVEGDLGMRWSAPGVVTTALSELLITEAEAEVLRPLAADRADDPSSVAFAQEDPATDVWLAQLAAAIAVRRHARPTPPAVEGRDLRRVQVVVGSGGALRHASAAAETILAPCLTDFAGGWRVPRAAQPGIDLAHRLLCAGLLQEQFPDAARRVVAALAAPSPGPGMV